MENDQQELNYTKREFNYSSFVCAFTLPDSTNDEGIEAKQCIATRSVPKYVLSFASKL